VSLKDDVGRDRLAARRVIGAHERLSNRWDLLERSPDIAEFDSKAVNLHLIVNAPQKFDVSRRPVTPEIPRAIQTRAGLVAKGIRAELLRRQVRPIEVAPPHPTPAYVNLPRHSDRRGFEMLIQYVSRDVSDRLTHGHGSRLTAQSIFYFTGQHSDRGLGRTVVIKNMTIG